MLRKLQLGIGLGGNRKTFEHFGTVASRHIKPNEKHLNICKKGIKTFAQALSMEFRDSLVDYTEFSPNDSEFLIPVSRIQPTVQEGQLPESVEYDSVSLFLTLHDYENYPAKLKGIYGLLPKGGNIFIVEYNFKPWIHSLPAPRKVFKRWFGVGNERVAMQEESDCFERHTKMSLDDVISGAKDAGFETRHAEAYSVPHPKFFLYIGKK